MAINTDSAITALEKAQQAFDNAAVLPANAVQPWSYELVTFLSVGVLVLSCVS
jgi:hypothetical protein